MGGMSSSLRKASQNPRNIHEFCPYDTASHRTTARRLYFSPDLNSFLMHFSECTRTLYSLKKTCTCIHVRTEGVNKQASSPPMSFRFCQASNSNLLKAASAGEPTGCGNKAFASA